MSVCVWKEVEEDAVSTVCWEYARNRQREGLSIWGAWRGASCGKPFRVFLIFALDLFLYLHVHMFICEYVREKESVGRLWEAREATPQSFCNKSKI